MVNCNSVGHFLNCDDRPPFTTPRGRRSLQNFTNFVRFIKTYLVPIIFPIASPLLSHRQKRLALTVFLIDHLLCCCECRSCRNRDSGSTDRISKQIIVIKSINFCCFYHMRCKGRPIVAVQKVAGTELHFPPAM